MSKTADEVTEKYEHRRRRAARVAKWIDSLPESFSLADVLQTIYPAVRRGVMRQNNAHPMNVRRVPKFVKRKDGSGSD